MAGRLLHVRSGTPASRAVVMNAWRSVGGPTGLVIGLAVQPSHDAPGCVTVERLAVPPEEARPFDPFADDQVDRLGP